MKLKINKGQTGITLIALVVTIIVLLILAGISISMLMGQNGILNRATMAKTQNESSNAKEELVLAITSLGMNYHVNGQEGTYRDYIFSHEEDLKRELGSDDVIFNKDENTIMYKNNIFYIDEDGKTDRINGLILSDNKKTLKIEDGIPEESTLIVNLIDIEGNVTWTTSAPGIVTVTGNGTTATIKAVAAGTATITASCSGKSATCEVTVKIPSFDDYSWQEINILAKEIAKDKAITKNTDSVEKIINEKKYKANVGDKKKIMINDTEYVVRILGFNHDTLESGQTAYGDANITKAGISFEFATLLPRARMNATNTTKDGWGGSEIRERLNSAEKIDDIINLADLEKESAIGNNIIKSVNKSYIKSANDLSSVTTSSDKLWLLACSEIWNDGIKNGYYGGAVTSEGSQYEFYSKLNLSCDFYNDNLFKILPGVRSWGWWLRSPLSEENFCAAEGKLTNCWASGMCGIAPGFCV